MWVMGCGVCPCHQGPHSWIEEIRYGHNEPGDTAFTPILEFYKQRAVQIPSKSYLLPNKGNPGSLPSRGSLVFPPRAYWNSLVSSQGHSHSHQGAPGLLPSKASSHSLHSDQNPVYWNPQHFCNKGLWPKEQNTLSECITRTFFMLDPEPT